VLRYKVSSSFLGIVFTARCGFSKRSWPYVVACAMPWLLCAGQRCVSRLAEMKLHRRSFSGYYRFLSDGKWRLQAIFFSLFDLIVREFQVVKLCLVLDDTLCPKWGRKIFGTGSFFDHVKRPRAGYIWGHNWVVLAVVVQMGGFCWVALPFWIAIYRPKKSCPAKKFRTRHQLAVEALKAIRERFSGEILLLADGAYNNDSIVGPAKKLAIELVSRIRANAQLRRPKPPRQPKGKRGKKPKWGAFLPKLSVLARARRSFRTECVRIYGKTVTLNLREIVAYWPPLDRVVKVVISRDPKNRRRIAYLMTTDLNMTAVEVVEFFARRWTIEQLFSVAKVQLGLDSAEVRKERSVIRHAALCMALITWVEVWAHRCCPKLRERSFVSKLSELRSDSVAQTIFSSGPRSNRALAVSIGSLYAAATAAA
jgi:hypothetical protein